MNFKQKSYLLNTIIIIIIFIIVVGFSAFATYNISKYLTKENNKKEDVKIVKN